MTIVCTLNLEAPAIILPILAPFAFAGTFEKQHFDRTRFLKYFAFFLLIVGVSEVFTLVLQQSAATLSTIAATSNPVADYRGLSMVGILLFSGLPLILLAFSAGFLREPRRARLRFSLLGMSVLIILFIYVTSLGLTADLFVQLPILLVYRASVKLLYIVAFALVVLTAIFLDSVMTLQISLPKTWKSIAVAVRSAFIVVLLTTPIFLSHNDQLLTGNLGLSSSAQVDGVFENVHKWLNANSSSQYFRTLWLPQDIQTDYATRAFDPDTLILRSGSAPSRDYASPAITYVKSVLGFAANSSSNYLGEMLSLAAVKYIVVNLDNVQTSSPHVQYDYLTYWAEGNPFLYRDNLATQLDLKLVKNDRQFVIYENVAFRPQIVVYNRILALNEHLQDFSFSTIANYSGNLVQNPSFLNNLSQWNIVRGQWTPTQQSGTTAVLGTSQNPWAFLTQDIPVDANSSFVFSASMRLANALQSHMKIEWYDNSNLLIGGSILQPGINGDRDWFSVARVVSSPPRTSHARLYLGGGGAVSNSSVGMTWFSKIELKKAFVRFPYSPNLFESFLLNGLSDQTLLIHSDQLDPSVFKQLTSSVNTVQLDAGSGDPKTFTQEPRTGSLTSSEILAAGGVTNFDPLNGTWSSIPSEHSSSRYVAISSKGVLTTQFNITNAGTYRISLRLTAGSMFTLTFDSNVVSTSSNNDDQGFQWVESFAMNLSSGLHTLSLQLSGGLDLAYLHSISNMNQTIEQILGERTGTFKTIDSSPVKHVIRVANSHGSIVFLAENFDTAWQASTAQLKLEHLEGINAYSWGNAFLLPLGGSQEVTIYFAAQEYRNYLVIGYLVFWMLNIATAGAFIASWGTRKASRVRRIIFRRH
jgi:hypothetical protein